MLPSKLETALLWLSLPTLMATKDSKSKSVRCLGMLGAGLFCPLIVLGLVLFIIAAGLDFLVNF